MYFLIINIFHIKSVDFSFNRLNHFKERNNPFIHTSIVNPRHKPVEIIVSAYVHVNIRTKIFHKVFVRNIRETIINVIFFLIMKISQTKSKLKYLRPITFSQKS
jgi:hypothetical protein